jgi:excisionase family DNA binding protein
MGRMTNNDEKLAALERLRDELILGGRDAELAALDVLIQQAKQPGAQATGGTGVPTQTPPTPTGSSTGAGTAGGSRKKPKTYLKLKKKYYTPAEVAKRVGVSRQTIVKWIERGELEAEMTPGGHHRIPASVFHREGRGEAVQMIPLEDD